MKEIKLTQGLKTQVDDEDFDRLNQFNWCAVKSGNTFYAMRRSLVIDGKRESTLMHYEILGKSLGYVSDHIDGDGLNNRRNNLRLVTKRQNNQNRKNQIRGKTSKYPGVDWYKQKGKWRARIYIDGRTEHLGFFVSELDAFNVYHEAVIANGEKIVGE